MLPFTRLRQSQRHNLREVIPLQKPFAITIDPSSLCNYRCIHCLHGNDTLCRLIDKRLMQVADFKRVIDDIAKWPGPKLKVIKLYNCGEPLLNPEFIVMLKYAKDANVSERIDLTSNCSLMTPRISAKLVEYELDYLRASISSPIQERHERITGSKVALGAICDNLSHLRKVKTKRGSEKPFVAAKMFWSSSEEENRLFLEKFSAVADEVFFEKLHNFADFEGTDFIGSYYGNQPDEIVAPSDGHPVVKKACPWPFMSLTVQSNGDTHACCVDWLGSTRVGNAFKQPIQEIWEGDTLFEFRRMQLENRRHENASCRTCGVYLSDDFTVDNIDGFPVGELRRKDL
ncbi:MAG: radical SAM/SPASM domain-containing protein [Thermodesulfobacteriota bacterium]